MTEAVVTATCPYGCDWEYTGDTDDAKYERRLHEEREHRDQVAPLSVSANDLLRVTLCSYGGCGEEADVKGMCFYHARHATAEVHPLPEIPETDVSDYSQADPEPEPAVKDCQALGCTNDAYQDGLCVEHAPKPRALYEHPEWTRTAVTEAAQRWAADRGGPPTSTQWTKRMPGWPTYQDVRKHFDTWADFLEGAGFQHGGASTELQPAHASGQDEIPHKTTPEIRPEPEPEPIDWQHHPDLLWVCTAQEDMDEFGGPGMIDAAMEFDEAVHAAGLAIRRLRAAHACLQALSDPLVARANALLAPSEPSS